MGGGEKARTWGGARVSGRCAQRCRRDGPRCTGSLLQPTAAAHCCAAHGGVGKATEATTKQPREQLRRQQAGARRAGGTQARERQARTCSSTSVYEFGMQNTAKFAPFGPRFPPPPPPPPPAPAPPSGTMPPPVSAVPNTAPSGAATPFACCAKYLRARRPRRDADGSGVCGAFAERLKGCVCRKGGDGGERVRFGSERAASGAHVRAAWSSEQVSGGGGRSQLGYSQESSVSRRVSQ